MEILLVSTAIWYYEKEWTQAGIWKIQIRYKENYFHCESEPRQEQIVQRGSISGGVQDLTGQIPEQPDLIRPVLSRVLDSMISGHPSNLSYSVWYNDPRYRAG